MAGKIREIVIHPPFGGYVASTAFQHQEPYTHPGSLNFIARDLKTGRKRASLRPRLAAYGGSVASSNPVRGLAQLNVATGDTLTRGLYAFSNGAVYQLTAGPAWSSVGSSQTDTNRPISAAPYLQKLFIAGKAAGRPKVYNWNGGSGPSIADIAISPGTATTLDNATIVTAWNDTLVWSGNSTTPHAWYMSRQGDPLDYEFGLASTDVTAAVDGTNLDGGNIGEKITALVAHSRECLLFGGTDSLQIVRGHPRQGGRLDVLSNVVGPLSQFSWCKTGDESTVFLTRNGLYVMPPGCGAALKPVSKQKIPDELMGIDTATYSPFVGYDTRFDGVVIAVTETAGASSARQAFWLDWEDGSYWPLEYTTTEQPQSLMRFDPLDGENVSGLLYGGSGGGVRRWDRTDEASIASGYLYLGPIKLSPTRFHKGIIQKITGIFGTNTTDTGGTVAIYCADSGEAAYAAAVANTLHRKWSGTVAQLGNNLALHPRVGGHAAVIKISLVDGTEHIAMEELTITVQDAGLMR